MKNPVDALADARSDLGQRSGATASASDAPAGGNQRIEGWESRFNAVVAGALDKPYRLGRYDCFLFACACAEALTGVNPGLAHHGTYRGRIGAARRIREFAGGGMREGITKLLGVPPGPPRLARRGDWMLWTDAAGQDHIGVCLGATAALLAKSGLNQVALDDCSAAWPVGR